MSTVVDGTECEADCSIDDGSTAPCASGRKAGATPGGNPERGLEDECHAVVDGGSIGSCGLRWERWKKLEAETRRVRQSLVDPRVERVVPEAANRDEKAFQRLSTQAAAKLKRLP
jgi:hypothetical protein